MKTTLARTQTPHVSFQQFFIRTVTRGLLGVLPIALLILGVYTVLSLASRLLLPFAGALGLELNTGSWLGGIISFTICLLLFFLLGITLRTPKGAELLGKLENDYFRMLPFYSTIRDSLQAFVGSTQSPFSQVVLVDCYNTGILMTGFVTDEHPSGIVTVFVPTGPNPANGCIYHVPKAKVTYVDVKIDEALRSIISVGVGSSLLFDHTLPNNNIAKVIIEEV